MMIFSTIHLMDEDKCYGDLLKILHPNGLHCPACGKGVEEIPVHRWDRKPVLYYHCSCGRIFNAFTGTVWQGTHCRCSEIVRILQGIAQGVSTKQLAEELGMDRKHLLKLRHKLQEFANQERTHTPLPDSVVEADEMFQNAGEKGVPHTDPDDPPRRRGNKLVGHGTYNNDRPPVLGIIGRFSGRVRCEVVKNTAQQDLEPRVLETTEKNSVVNTDEWGGYNNLSKANRGHVTVCHSHGEWARDDDGDDKREVHTNTIEGFWTGLRNYLRPFRGLNKVYLQAYIAIHEWAHNIKNVTLEFLRILCGVRQFAC